MYIYYTLHVIYWLIFLNAFCTYVDMSRNIFAMVVAAQTVSIYNPAYFPAQSFWGWREFPQKTVVPTLLPPLWAEEFQRNVVHKVIPLSRSSFPQIFLNLMSVCVCVCLIRVTFCCCFSTLLLASTCTAVILAHKGLLVTLAPHHHYVMVKGAICCTSTAMKRLYNNVVNKWSHP